MALPRVIEIPDDGEMWVFLQKGPSFVPTLIQAVDIPLIETEALETPNWWTCGLCGRSNPVNGENCAGCGAPSKHARLRGCVQLESWLPYGGIFYSLGEGFTLYILWKRCGRPDTFYPEEIVYTLENCIAGPVQATDVAKGCREEGWCSEIPLVSCEVTCDCVYVGNPWKDEIESEEP